MIITEEDRVIAKSNLYDQPEKDLLNYIRSRSLLEYAHWLLAEIDYFDEYGEFAEKISQFDALRSRMQYIEETLKSAAQENMKNSDYFKHLFNTSDISSANDNFSPLVIRSPYTYSTLQSVI